MTDEGAILTERTAKTIRTVLWIGSVLLGAFISGATVYARMEERFVPREVFLRQGAETLRLSDILMGRLDRIESKVDRLLLADP